MWSIGQSDMDILLTLFTIWMVTFILSFAANNAQASNERKIAEREEDNRKKRLNALYGRED